MNSHFHCYTIPAGEPFLNVLAHAVLAAHGRDPASLTKLLILLPNRRSCRALHEVFLEVSGGKPILLPAIQPIGDVDEPAAFHYESVNASLPPAIDPLRRLFRLTRLVMEFKQRQSAAASGRIFSVEQAAELASQLARFMDESARFGLDFDRLSQLVPQDLSQHWQQTLEFLGIIAQQWPAILSSEGMIDPVDHRNRQLHAIAKLWQKQPPAMPVIAAGSTGSSPATAALLKTIARMPQGQVILPGLDTHMPEREWNTLGETHPQFAMKQLLERVECERGLVSTLSRRERGCVSRGEGGCTIDSPHPNPLPTGEGEARLACLRAILQSPEATSAWPQLALPLEEGLKDVRLLVADTLHDEARMIAIAMREALETPAQTVALVTPDRTLARMVAAQMQRFGVLVDDSAGHPLAGTPTGCFLRLLADMAAGQAAPGALLALLRHPLAAAGRDTGECRFLARQLETRLLRGLRRAPGLTCLRDAAEHPPLKDLLAALEEYLQPLLKCFTQKLVPLRELLEAHIQCAEWLATTDKEPGAQRLWSGEAGQRLADLLAGFIGHADQLAEIDPVTYPGLLNVLLAGHNYYPRYGLHPRLHILSPMEARLQHFDQVILGGLNEGTWPTPSEIDPWMSRPMRAAFGLPPPEQAVGQSAHDVFLLCSAPRVLLTRSRKVDGTPTVPSRWLVRLETLVKGIDKEYFQRMSAHALYEQAKDWLDRPVPLPPAQRPQPRPLVAARPRKLKVTAVDEWLADPYRTYARYVLHLRKLADLDESPDAADFGNLVHKTMELFTARWPSALPANPHAALIRCGREVFEKMLAFPAVASLWWPRFEAMAVWVIEQESACRGGVLEILAEVKGQWDLEIDGRPFTLVTVIDRLERRRDATIAIADYKTGSLPKLKDIEEGTRNQLPLEALIAAHGQLAPALPTPVTVSGLQYWKLSARSDKAEIVSVAPQLADAARNRLYQLIRHYDQEGTAYAAPEYAPAQSEEYNDYRHLTRRQEWSEG